MHLDLVFEKGVVSGSGFDGIGRFSISGSYDEGTLECEWIKQYIGQHQVLYRGGADHHGIWGTWRIVYSTGGFHIWPLQATSGEEEVIRAEEPLPMQMPKRVPSHAFAE